MIKAKFYKEIERTKSEGEEIVKRSVVLFEWEAFDRLTNDISKYSLRKIGIICLFLAFVALLIKDFWLIIVIGVIYFVIYVFVTAPASMIKHKITNNGIFYACENLYRWDEILDFYTENKGEENIIYFNTKRVFPARIFIIVAKDVDFEKLIETINQYVSIREKGPDSKVDKLAKVIAKKLNI